MERAAEIRVLVVDDEREMVVALSDILSASGYTVDVAVSGREAIERVREHRPDCILMDIRMPGLNGVESFREIRKLSPDSFVIFMTAYSSSELVREALAEGAVEVLDKPLDIDRVLGLIAQTAQTTPVLVVDDDVDFCASLADALEARDFDVRTAQNVDEAVHLFEKEPRRVVILDLRLDERSGLAALVIFKELNPRAAVILMTGFPEYREDVQKCLEASAYACLWKPFEVEVLIRTIRAAVDRR